MARALVSAPDRAPAWAGSAVAGPGRLTPEVERLEARIEELNADRARLLRENQLHLGKLRWHWATYPWTVRDWRDDEIPGGPYDARRTALRSKLVELLSAPEFPTEDRRVTVVVTSCKRHDLLERTLESFFKTNSYPIEKVIVVEDGEEPFAPALKARFADHPMDWMNTGERLGQIRAIDAAYSRIATPYVFHMEDDWEFVRSRFIEMSMPILEAEPLCLQVWLRGRSGPYFHRFAGGVRLTSGVRWRQASPSPVSIWHGFSFNPGLRRLRDYRLIGSSYSANVESRSGKGGLAEGQLSELYASVGYFAASLWIADGKRLIAHLGRDRHVL